MVSRDLLRHRDQTDRAIFSETGPGGRLNSELFIRRGEGGGGRGGDIARGFNRGLLLGVSCNCMPWEWHGECVEIRERTKEGVTFAERVRER